MISALEAFRIVQRGVNKKRAGCSCIVEACPNPVHAKGYCRKHYGQIWRRGVIYETPEPAERAVKTSVKALKNKLRECRANYERVVGLQGRVYWAREVASVKAAIAAAKDAMMREGV